MFRRRNTNAFTLVELLVVIAIIGVLVSLLLPAVNAAREAARRTQCMNGTRQIGLAILNHESALSLFPSGRTVPWPKIEDYSSNGRPFGAEQQGWSWAFQILPYLEEGPKMRIVTCFLLGAVDAPRKSHSAFHPRIVVKINFETSALPCACSAMRTINSCVILAASVLQNQTHLIHNTHESKASLKGLIVPNCSVGENGWMRDYAHNRWPPVVACQMDLDCCRDTRR